MKILVGADVPCDPDSGAAGTVYRTNEALRRLGHEVDEFWASDLPHFIRHGNLHYLVELPRGYKYAVRRRVAGARYDVIQLSQPQAWLAAREHRDNRRPGIFVNRSHGVETRVDAAVLLWRRRLGVPASGFPRSLVSGILRHLLGRQWPAAVRSSDGIIVPCEEDRQYVLTRYRAAPDRVKSVHHGVPDLFLDCDATPWSSDRAKRILHIAQFSFFKGPHILGKVVSQLLTERPDVRFTWICPRVSHAQAAMLFDPSVRERIEFLDSMAQDRLLTAYDEHGIFIFPTIAEGAAKSSMEALSRGLCVIASDTSGMKDYIKNEENGFLVAVGHVEGFVAAARRILADSALAARVSEQARNAALTYRWSRCAAEAVRFYEYLIEHTPNKED